MKTTHDDDFLRAALAGYEAQMQSISAKMETIRQQLRGRTKKQAALVGVPGAAQGSPQKKHKISAEGRERIAAAQRRRWAAAKKTAA